MVGVVIEVAMVGAGPFGLSDSAQLNEPALPRPGLLEPMALGAGFTARRISAHLENITRRCGASSIAAAITQYGR